MPDNGQRRIVAERDLPPGLQQRAYSAESQSANVASMVRRRTELAGLGDLIKPPMMHKTLPEARILPNLSAVKRTTAHLGISARTGVTTCGCGRRRTAGAILSLRPSVTWDVRRTTTKVTGSALRTPVGRSLVTEGNGHIIDPAGDARRALQAVVAEHGPDALSNAVIMDGICQARLSNLPGEATLIGSAARTDVPTLLRDLIPRLGNYGAIQSVAATLAEAHGLDTAACVWVVREFARALGLIASGGTQPAVRIGPGGGTGQGTAPPPGPAGPQSPGPAGPPPGAAASLPSGAGGPPPPGPGGPPPPRPGGAGGPRTPGGPGGPGSPPGTPGGTGGAGERPSSGTRLLSRNTVGIAAAIALVAGYLGVAAVAHLSPFPGKTVAATSSAPATGGNNSPGPDGSPDPAPDPSPTSDYQILLSKIPNVVQGANNCHNYGTPVGAIAVSECTGLQGLAASTIFYYLFSDSAALSNGFRTFLANEKFRRQTACTSNNDFISFIAECESGFTSTSPNMTGSVAEYANTSNDPIIVSTDNQPQVMAVMVGTNDGDLLAYWKQLQWVVT